MPRFEILYAELSDLAEDDPMRPAAIVHVLGPDAQDCYADVRFAHSIYTIGRGTLPAETSELGYFFTASEPDFEFLRSALLPHWPDVPGFPPKRLSDDARIITSQEMADVINYVMQPRLPDETIFGEARRSLRGLVPKERIWPTAQVTKWLVENMLPANNCFTLSAIYARWLRDAGAPAKYCVGEATFRKLHQGAITINHAWVQVKDQVCDLTVDKQRTWGDVGTTKRIGVRNPRIVYRPSEYHGPHALDDFWRTYSKPSGRPSYSEQSRRRQREMIAEMGPVNEQQWLWIRHIWESGILEGTLRLLQESYGQERSH